MKTIEQLESEFSIDLEKLQGELHHSEYNAKYTGDIVADFAQFTLLQSGDPKNGYKSDDPKDPMAKFAPSLPDANGHKYHTVMDIGYPTFERYFPQATPYDFYNMTFAQRGVCISGFINAGKQTTSDAVNILLSYIIWGGSLGLVLKTYHEWYINTTLQADVMVSEHGTFVKLIDVRRFVYTNELQHSVDYAASWDLGILSFWKLFKNYLK